MVTKIYNSWQTVVTKKNKSVCGANPPYTADFAKNIYIVASLGMKPNLGYTVKIEQIRQEKDKITIRLKFGEPEPKKFYAQVIVHPISVAEVPLVNLRLSISLLFVFVDEKGKQLASVKADF